MGSATAPLPLLSRNKDTAAQNRSVDQCGSVWINVDEMGSMWMKNQTLIFNSRYFRTKSRRIFINFCLSLHKYTPAFSLIVPMFL